MTSLSPMLWVVCVAIKDQITCTKIEVLHQGDNVKITMQMAFRENINGIEKSRIETSCMNNFIFIDIQ